MIARWLDRIDQQRPAEPKRSKPPRLRAVPEQDSQRPVGRRASGARTFSRPAERHGHLTTSAHIQAAYPWQIQAGLPRGSIVGRQAWGGVFTFDQWIAYELGLVADPNVIVLGLLGQGKSALAKTLCLRQQVFGRRVEILDRKSEYRPLIDALGGVVVRLEPGTRINPLERVIGRESRESLLRAVARALLKRDLRPCEGLGLALALEAVDERFSEREVVIPDLIAELREPSQLLAAGMDLSRSECAAELRELTYALRGLEAGPLRGLFDGPTTHGESTWSRQAVCVDIEGLARTLYGEDESTAVALALMCSTAFLDGRRRGQDAKTVRLNDEAWRAIAVHPAYYAASLKLSRASGVSTMFAVHRLSDLSASGDQGSRAQQLATGLLAEISTRVIYRQSPNEIPATVAALGLTDTERDYMPRLGKGQALWRVGSRGYLVQHQVTAAEWPLIDTDHLMRDRSAA